MKYGMVLRAYYAMSGTTVAYSPTVLAYAMSGAAVACFAMSVHYVVLRGGLPWYR